MNRGAAALALLLGLASAAAAQDSSALRLGFSLSDDLQPGRRAPAISLPYAIADSAGPVSQPFVLSKELGNVVVLIFYEPALTAATAWRAIDTHLRPLLANGVVVAGISSQSVLASVAFAHSIDSPFKFLADGGNAMARAFGAVNGRGTRPMMLVVVGRDGVVRAVDKKFDPVNPRAFTTLDVTLAKAMRR